MALSQATTALIVISVLVAVHILLNIFIFVRHAGAMPNKALAIISSLVLICAVVTMITGWASTNTPLQYKKLLLGLFIAHVIVSFVLFFVWPLVMAHAFLLYPLISSAVNGVLIYYVTTG